VVALSTDKMEGRSSAGGTERTCVSARSRALVATLTRIFGVHNLTLAEDVVQDAFCRAVDIWNFRGMPKNPSAGILTAAKHRALDVRSFTLTTRQSNDWLPC
jgi:predicted RNA polymerase sigma factor